MNIKADGYIEKASKLAEGEVEFVVSTNAIDSHGERINVEGIELADFKKNPVVLWGHDGFNLPIAKATKVWKESGKLMARAKFYLKDDFARKVYEYILDGYLNAVSIGGVVKEWGDDGITIVKMDMKEFSVVSIPANQEALVSSKAMSGEQRAELRGLANAYARKCLEKDAGVSQVQKDIETLEMLVSTLKEVAFVQTDDETKEDRIKTLHVVLRQAQVVDHQVEKVIKVVKKGVSNE